MLKNIHQSKQIPKVEKQINHPKRKPQSQTDSLPAAVRPSFHSRGQGHPKPVVGQVFHPLHGAPLVPFVLPAKAGHFSIQAEEGHPLTPSLVRHNSARQEPWQSSAAGGELRLSAEPAEEAGWADGKDVPWTTGCPSAGWEGAREAACLDVGQLQVPSMWLVPPWREPFPLALKPIQEGAPAPCQFCTSEMLAGRLSLPIPSCHCRSPWLSLAFGQDPAAARWKL